MTKKIYIMLTVLWMEILFMPGCTGRIRESFQVTSPQMRHMSHEEAIPAYREYLSKNPDDLRIKSRLGFALIKTNRPDEAIKEFEEVLRAEPGDPYSVLYMGLAYLNKDALSKAINIWQGYRNRKQPKVEKEISRLLTLLQIIESQRAAKKVLAEEEKLQAVNPEPHTIAVFYYKDLTPDKTLQALEKGLAALVIADLSKISTLKVIERMRVQALLEEIKLGQTTAVDQETSPRFGRLLGVENLITGNLTTGSIQATTSLSSASKGTIKSVITSSAEQDKFYELSMSVVQGVVRTLDMDLTLREIEAVGTPQTTSYKAFIFFSQALDALDIGDWKKARDLFDKALEQDPGFGMARKGRDSCPEIWFPDISKLRDMKTPQILDMVETAINRAISEQRENNELISPGKPEKLEKPEKPLEPGIIKTDKRSKQNDDIRNILDEITEKDPGESPHFPEPPMD